MKKISVYTLVILSALSTSALAKLNIKPNFTPAPFPIQVSVVNTQGEGCPPGTASATLAPDGSAVSILFSELSTDVPATPTPLIQRKVCTVSLGIRFGGQYRIAIVGSDVRGFVAVPEAASSKISIQHQSIYSLDPKLMAKMNFSQTFVGPKSDNVMFSSRFPNDPMWSQCGTQFSPFMSTTPFMFITIDINSQNQNPDQNLLAGIDSFDLSTINAGIDYQIAWAKDTKNCPK